MSTRSTLAMKIWQIEKSLHLYKEMIDGKTYLTDEVSIIEIPPFLIVPLKRILEEQL